MFLIRYNELLNPLLSLRNTNYLTMKRFFYLAAVIVLAGCTDPEMENKIAELNEENAMLKQQMSGQSSESDSTIGAFVEAFNDIQENLNTIKEKEKLLTINAGNPEFEQNEKERILQDIAMINELIERNKRTIGALRSKLKTSNARVAELEEFVQNLTVQIQEKEAQIAALQIELSNTNEQIAVLFEEYNERVGELSEATTELNTGYYCYGTSKELKENGVITKEGGFIGIGKIEKLKDDFNEKYFTKVDIREVKEIALNVKKAKIVTSHPSSSFELSGENGGDKLTISDAEAFWKSSKYLVIIVEN